MILAHMSTSAENLMKIGQLLSEITGGCANFYRNVPKITTSNIVILGVTGEKDIKDTKFLTEDVEGSSQLLMHQSALRYSNRLWNATKYTAIFYSVYASRISVCSAIVLRRLPP